MTDEVAIITETMKKHVVAVKAAHVAEGAKFSKECGDGAVEALTLVVLSELVILLNKYYGRDLDEIFEFVELSLDEARKETLQ